MLSIRLTYIVQYHYSRIIYIFLLCHMIMWVWLWHLWQTCNSHHALSWYMIAVITIDTSWIQHRLGSRITTTWSAMLQQFQSAPHVVGATSLLYPHVIWLCLPHVLWTLSSWLYHTYSINTILYPYALPITSHPFLTLKPLPKCNLSSKLRS